MKLVEHFDEFLADTVNINASRLEKLESSVVSIENFIKDSDWGPTVRFFEPQGSWAHGTIIKPVEGRAFDADLLAMVDPVEGWSAKQYLTTLRSVFANSGTYEDKVMRSSHCITIEYAGVRRIDIAPCVVGISHPNSYHVCNGTKDEFQTSAPTEFTAWFKARNMWTGKNGLRKVARLAKYLRDIKTTFTCASFLFSVILGDRITSADATNEIDFQDVPTALRTIVRRLDEWLQERPSKPTILNPVLSSEVVSDLWTAEQYVNFRDKIHEYREWIDDAYDEKDKDETIGKWRRVFGDDFAKSVTLSAGATVTEAARRVLSSAGTIFTTTSEDLVALFKRFGRKALPPGFDTLPHK